MEKRQFLKLVSNVTMEKASDMTIITPEVFNELNEYGFAQEINHEYYLNFEKRISRQTDELLDDVDKAAVAIEEHDDVALGQIKAEVEKLKKELEETKDELYRDPLTKVYNRKWLSEVLCDDDVFIKNGVLTFIDLNDFKIINGYYKTFQWYWKYKHY